MPSNDEVPTFSSSSPTDSHSVHNETKPLSGPPMQASNASETRLGSPNVAVASSAPHSDTIHWGYSAAVAYYCGLLFLSF